MQHRDKITILKIIEEIDIGIKLLGTASLEQFLENEMLKLFQHHTYIRKEN